MKPADRVNRVQEQQPAGATVLEVRWENVLIEYDEGGQGWWPIGSLSIIDDTDWPAFKRAMLTSPEVNAALSAAMATAPLAVLALPTALERAVSGDYSDFRGCWAAIRRAAAVPQAVVDAVVAEAQAANLPEGFVEALRGGQPG